MHADDVEMADAASGADAGEFDDEDAFILAALGKISLSSIPCIIPGEPEPPAAQPIELIYDRSVNFSTEVLPDDYDIARFHYRPLTVPGNCTFQQLQEAVLKDLNESNFDKGLRAENYIIKHKRCEKDSTSRFNGCYCNSRTSWYPLRDINTPVNATLEEMGLRLGHYHVQVCVPNPDRR